MMNMLLQPRRLALQFMALTAAGALASCAPMTTAPERVHAANPTVAYDYRTDAELLQAREQAVAYCNQYRATPRTIDFGSDGTVGRVAFECVPAMQVATPPPPPDPAMTYTYRTPQELLRAQHSAETYCLNAGQRTSSTIVTNPDGSRTVTFQCVRG